MQIREANIDDADKIKKVYLQAFDDPESEMVSGLAVDLLEENHPVKTISLVAVENNEIVGHISFTPVFLEKTNEQLGYILAPLAVAPEFQKNKIGTSLVMCGLELISKMGSFIIFVYGDPQYYSRFGFKTELDEKFIPPYPLQYPEGWQALKSASAVFPEGGRIICVGSLNVPELW